MPHVSVASLIAARAGEWARTEKENGRSLPGAVLRHMEEKNKLRGPQIGAITARLWLQFCGENKTLSDMIIGGRLTGRGFAEENGFYAGGDSAAAQFFAVYADANNLPKIGRAARQLERGADEWESDLRSFLRDMPYPDRVYSLPMGAGKTYLMAAFICLDLHFSRLMPEDSRFCKNFVVFAPHASKTAILPSLKTIRKFDPEWVLPPAAAGQVRRDMRVEILDEAKAAKNSMRVNNPNLEKVNRLLQTRARGLVFVTNAEKVVLEKYKDADVPLIAGGPSGEREKAAAEKTNELRARLADVPALGVFLDEADRAYESGGRAEKKLRAAVGVLNRKGNLRETSGFTGTPYIKTRAEIAGESFWIKRLTNVVYDFPLAAGIGAFLKTPKVIYMDGVREKKFIFAALDGFFGGHDKIYAEGAKSKAAFYCPSIAALNGEILPAVKEWYAANRPGKEGEIFAYYAEKSKKYPLPKDALAKFHGLDSPHSGARVVLLVAVGTRGWDCRSLTSVVLPRDETSASFVLQTSCRCLREMDGAAAEKALIVLNRANYGKLAEELKRAHDMTVSQFESGAADWAPVLKRKPKLGKMRWREISARWHVESEKAGEPPEKALEKFAAAGFDAFVRANDYAPETGGGEIKKSGAVAVLRRAVNISGELPLDNFSHFLTELQRALWGLKTAAELSEQHGEVLRKIYGKMKTKKRGAWFASHPAGGKILDGAVRAVADCFGEAREYRREEILRDAEIELLEWRGEGGQIGWGSGVFLPEVAKSQLARLQKRPGRIEEDLEDAAHDLQDISFNYAPYRFDSGFERGAILEMLKEKAFAGLELYYNGMTHSGLQSFSITTPHGRYTPDFLLLRRRGGAPYRKSGKNAPIGRALIIETKGKPFYDAVFRAKERFVKKTFLPRNPHLNYVRFLDEGGKNNFLPHMQKLRETVLQWLGNGEQP